jgi:RNA polymerase sigma-70 factor (ECF subfamily)
VTDFEKIYNVYYQDVFRFVMALCHDKGLAEDITQETFLKAIKNIKSFRKQCEFKVWLCQIAKNHYYTVYKQNKKYVHYDQDNWEEKSDSFELKFAKKETAFEVHKVLHLLDEPYKEVFSLRVFGELSFIEIGVLFGKNDSWARVTFYRAKLKIKEVIE